MRTFLRHFLEKLQASAWTTPVVYSFLAFWLARYTLHLDQQQIGLVLERSGSLPLESPESARALLGTIATSTLSVAGISFSSIMVTMTLASQQFGPRLLRNFLKDTVSQRTLAILLATYVYCLFVLKGFQATEGSIHVPQLSTLVALGLALISLGFFIGFIQHILGNIQAENVVADAFGGLTESIETVFPEKDAEQVENNEAASEKEGPQVTIGKTGYLQAVNVSKLVELANEKDLVLATDCRAGRFITSQQAALKVVKGDSKVLDDEEFVEELRDAFYVGVVRTSEQDYEYGFRQLVEVALRALSPGINDPFTAMDCIDYLGAGLQLAFQRPLPPSVHRDEEGTVRLTTWRTRYQRLVSTALDQIRQAARDKCDVSCRLLEMLEETAPLARTQEQQEALAHQAQLIVKNAVPEMFNQYDCTSIKERYDAFCKACKLITPNSDHDV